MLRPRLIPCLLLRDGRLVKTVRFRDPSYVGDPTNTIRIFDEMEVDELLFLDIGAGRDGRSIDWKLLEGIATECFMPFGYGGGVRTVEDMGRLYTLGAEKVVLNTAAYDNPALVSRAAERFGSQSVVVSIDVKTEGGRSHVYVEGGRRRTQLDPVDFAKRMAEAGAGELLVTSIDRDGTFQGYDLALVERVAGSVSIPIVCCGGAASLQGARAGIRAGASGAGVGSMVVYQGKNRAVLINYPAPQELREAFGAQSR